MVPEKTERGRCMVNRRNILIGGGAAVAAGAAAWALAPRPDYAGLAAAIRDPGPPQDDLASLAAHATLAANGHNTQPWLFSRAGDRVTIAPDFSRATPVVDPNDHHLFASLGCAAENLMLAAAAAGRPAESRFVEDGDGSVEIDLASGAAARDPLFDAIPARQSTRSLYDGRPVSAGDLKAIEQAAALAGARVLIVTDEKKIEQMLEMIVAANTAQTDDPAFRKELKDWLRFGPRAAVAKRDGLYAPCSGNPALPDWLGHAIFDHVFTTQGENDKYAAQIRSSAGLAVIVSNANNRAHWVEAGRACQRFALATTARGIRQAFLNQPLEVAAMREDFVRWLGDDALSPDMILRFGHADPLPFSLRRPVAEVIV